MQEEKSKLKAFTSAVTAAAQERAAKINAGGISFFRVRE